MRALLLIAVLLLAGCFGGSNPDESDELEPNGGTRPISDAQLSATGRWTAPFDGQVPAVNMVLMHTGEVLYWSGVEAAGTNPEDVPFLVVPPYAGESRVLTFQDGQPFVIEPGMPDGGAGDLFCSGQTILPDGRILTAGGSDYHGGPNENTPFLLDGIRDTRIFDPETRNWTTANDMLLARWYPSLITGADGQAIAASGIQSLTDPNDHWESWETYRALDDEWAQVAGTDQLLPLYPRISVVAGGPYKGDVFYNTLGTLWGPFGEHPLEAQWSFQHTYNPGSQSWTQLGLSTFGARQHGASVMLPLDASNDYAPEFVNFGGSLYRSPVATNLAERVNLATSPPTNSVAASMESPRWHLNGMLLPDGNVMAIGGGTIDNVYAHGVNNLPIMSAELYDASADTWTTLPEMEVPRMYHSTAMLLPDGRVLAGGHVPLPQEPTNPLIPQIAEKRLEIYEPGYLFRGERPSIESAPQFIGYGDTFQIEATGNVTGAILMRPGATTHAFEGNQRGITLELLDSTDGVLTIATPPDSRVTAPGYHMLFVLQAHEDGPTPSEAAWVQLS